MIGTASDILWVCTDCYFALNGFSDHELGNETAPDPEPMCLVSDDVNVTPGIMREEHDEDCTPDDECECETHSFSWHRCHGCGSQLGGTRHGVTVWDR